jgi:hypothetical protein
MPGKTPREIVDWVGENYTRMDHIQLTDELNRHFGTNMTVTAVRSLKKREGFNKPHPRVIPQSKLWPPEVQEYISDNAEGTSYRDMLKGIEETFGITYTVQQLKSYYGNHHINSGMTGQFVKGRTPHNKGRKISPELYEKIKPTMFKKGIVPHNTVPVGTRVTDTEGYLKIKTAEPDVWQYVHRLEWMRHNGDIPEGCVVNFLDGDKTNTDIGNLVLLTRAEHLELSRMGLRTGYPEATKAAIAAVRLRIKCRMLKKERDDGDNGSRCNGG